VHKEGESECKARTITWPSWKEMWTPWRKDSGCDMDRARSAASSSSSLSAAWPPLPAKRGSELANAIVLALMKLISCYVSGVWCLVSACS
jgi:hypothetical protein